MRPDSKITLYVKRKTRELLIDTIHEFFFNLQLANTILYSIVCK